MDNNAIADIIGTLAGILTTVSFVPQVIKTLRSRSTGDLSLAMFVSFCLGVALWLIYGVLKLAWPVIVANLFTLALAGIILSVKIKQAIIPHRSAPPKE